MSKRKTAPPAPAPEFDQHLASVRQARELVDEAVSTLDQALGMANHAVKTTWEFLFDHLCREKQKKLSVAQLNMISGIIYRQTQTMEKLQGLKEDAQAKNKLLAEMALQLAGLPEGMREQLERDLKLL